MVEDIFALAVRLDIGRGDGGGAAVIAVDDDRQGLPAAASADCAGFLQRGQESMADERVGAAGAGIPIGGGDLADAVGQAGGDAGHYRPI
ncbi:hypothetical protein QE452_003531 [Sphingomonas sp. SORGH_AS438]|nr:hypothetical protein [Sphingomonas sp. SORGH_AS_0438]